MKHFIALVGLLYGIYASFAYLGEYAVYGIIISLIAFVVLTYEKKYDIYDYQAAFVRAGLSEGLATTTIHMNGTRGLSPDELAQFYINRREHRNRRRKEVGLA